MGRTRGKSKKSVPKVTEAQINSTAARPTVSSLLEKAQTLIIQCDYELARLFVLRVLEQSPTNAEAKEMLGVVQLETGEIDAARKVSHGDLGRCRAFDIDGHLQDIPFLAAAIPECASAAATIRASLLGTTERRGASSGIGTLPSCSRYLDGSAEWQRTGCWGCRPRPN